MQPMNSRDPAPNKWRYRFQRWWLTPWLRALIRTGVPAFLVVFGVMILLSNDENRARFNQAIKEARQAVQNRPEFMVETLVMNGTTYEVEQEIRTHLNLSLPQSTYDLNLDHIHAKLLEIPSIQSATIHVTPDLSLVINANETPVAARWFDGEIVWLVDVEGRKLRPAPRQGSYPAVPFLSGLGATDQIPQALYISDAFLPLRGDLRDHVPAGNHHWEFRGLIRVGDRRWDVILRDENGRDQRILLPAENPVPAAERVVLLAQAQDLLDRDVVRVDMRVPNRPVVRLGPQARAGLDALRNSGNEGDIQ